MQALERMKEQTDDKGIKDLIDDLTNQISELPDRIEEKRLIKERARNNFKR